MGHGRNAPHCGVFCIALGGRKIVVRGIPAQAPGLPRKCACSYAQLLEARWNACGETLRWEWVNRVLGSSALGLESANFGKGFGTCCVRFDHLPLDWKFDYIWPQTDQAWRDLTGFGPASSNFGSI